MAFHNGNNVTSGTELAIQAELIMFLGIAIQVDTTAVTAFVRPLTGSLARACACA